MRELKIDLPCPPSTNHLYIHHGHGRHKSPRYKRWLKDVGYFCNLAQKLEDKPYQITILANVDRRRDIDNLIKPILDAMVRSQMVPDDRWCDYVTVGRSLVPDQGMVRVTWEKF
jgi:Holliday junction resolvase RusA-like endonuclease